MSASPGGCLGPGPVGSTVAAALQFFAASQCLLQEPYPPQANVINGSSFDFIIVGGGTAGCALAARLADVPHFQVLLVEAGEDPPAESIVPGFRRKFGDGSYDWNFTTVDDGYSSQALAGHREQLPRGKLLGGCGSINDMVYSRGHPVDYYEWADIVVGETWNWTNVLPYFMKTEQMTDKRIIGNCELMKLHGTDGEIEVSGNAELDHFTAMLLESYAELGFDVVDDMTNPYKIGAGRFSHTIKDGQRHSSLTALLNKVGNNNNLKVLKNTFVVKILTQNTTAVGIKAIMNGDEYEFFANKEVIVSAGTFNTAKLLLLSGIGPKDYLEEIGIDVVQDLPVGNNLQDHVMVVNYLAADNGTCGHSKAGEYFNAIKYLYDRSGSWSYSDSMGIYLPQRDQNPNVPYFAIYPSCIPQAGLLYEHCIDKLTYTEENCRKLAAESERNDLITLAIILLKPQSRGKVRLFSTDPLDGPAIYSGTFSNIADLEEYPEAIKTALSLANTTFFMGKRARIIDLTPEKCLGLDEDEIFRCEALEFAMTAWHSVGTVAMGTVLDEELRVLGMQLLRVVDASVMPAVIRGNTNAPVVMIAEKAADFIKNTHGVTNL